MLWTNLFAFLDGLQAIHARHSHVEQNQTGIESLLHALNGLEAASGRLHRVVIHFEQGLRITKHAGFVINDQNGGVCAHDLLFGPHWQQHAECTPVTVLALYPDFSCVRFYQATCDRQPKSHTV